MELTFSQLCRMPIGMARQTRNTSRCTKNGIEWRVEWADKHDVTLASLDRVFASEAPIQNFIPVEVKNRFPLGFRLLFYEESGRYCVLDATSTLARALEGRTIVEFPIIHVVSVEGCKSEEAT